jgi:O-antigen ligase
MISRLSSGFGVFWLSGFLALQGIPHAGAIKTLFSLLGILHLLFLYKNIILKPAWPKLNLETGLFIILTCWLILQSTVLATAPVDALSAWADEWLKLILLVLLGVWIVIRLDSGKKLAWLPLGLFGGCFIHVISTLAYQVWSFVSVGHIAPMNSFLGNYGYVSPFVSTVLAFLLAELLLRLKGQRWLPLANIWIFILFLMALLALAILDAKAAIVAFTMLFLLSAFIAAIETKSLRLLVTGMVICSSIILLTTMWSNRWEGAYASIAMANNVDVIYQAQHLWDTGTVTGDPSFYVRAIWMKMGLHGIIDHPFGLGYGSDAFGRYVVALGGEKGAISSHSGWIDFTLANGVPGFLLLFLLWGALMYRGWMKYRLGNPAGLVLLFFTMHFVVRSLMDGHLYGSHLIQFAFMASILWALTMQMPDDQDGRVCKTC